MQLALPRLTADESLTLVQSVPQSAHLPDHLRQAIVGTAAGNPFFLEELARAMGARNSQHAPFRIPDTIQAVLAARIDRLSPLTKRLLQAAAVIGVQILNPPACKPSGGVRRHPCGASGHLQAAE